MIHRRFEDVTKDDIDSLLANSVMEQLTLDYKAKLPGAQDAEKRELLFDATSFANALGGDILFGVVDARVNGRSTGMPGEAPGLAGINVDAESLRLTNLCRDAVSPPLTGVRIKVIDGFSDGPVLLMRIPQSYAAPHMVTSAWRFYSRTTGGKYPMGVTELRNAFVASEATNEKVSRFRDGRLSRILAGDTPAVLDSGPRLVLHILPVAAFSGRPRSFDVASLESEEVPRFRPSGYNRRRNFDGLLTYSDSRHYTQVFRDGCVEIVDTSVLPDDLIRVQAIEVFLQRTLSTYARLSIKLDIPVPWVVLISFLGVKDLRLGVDQWLETFLDLVPVDRADLIFPDVVVEDTESDFEQVLTPIFDQLWQAGGAMGSYRHDQENSRWVLRTAP